MNMSFNEWEQQLTNAPNFPNNNESRLAIQTLKVCITESPIETDEIARNGYALFDYVMFCYFIFRAGLCNDFPQNFVKSYDTYMQHLMSLYFNDFFNIPRETIVNLIISRADEYESLIRNDNSVYDIIETLSQYIQKDLAEMPEYAGVLIIGFDMNIELNLKLAQYIQETLSALDKQRAFILLCETKKSRTVPFPTPAPTKQSKAQSVPEEKETHTKKEQIQTAININEQECRQNAKRDQGNKVNSLKEKLTASLGIVGVILYFVISLILSILPFVMIGGNFFVSLLLIGINQLFPISSVVFWIWGLICAIKGVQDIWAIIYYIVFVIFWLPFYIDVIKSIFNKD